MNRPNLFKFCAIAFGIAAASMIAPSSWAQSGSGAAGLQWQVEELAATSQRNFQELAKAMNLFSELKGEVQTVKGQLDSAKYLTKENEKVYQDLDTRVASLEDKIGQIHTMIKEMRIGASDPATPKSALPSQAQQTQEFEEFQGLLNSFNAQDYRGAASGMMGFLKKYPQSSLSGNAQYWVAESFFSMGDYVKAIAEYQILSEKYPTHARVREGIYKQGVSFQKMKKTPEAKLFYQKVIANYANSPEALKAQSRLSRMESLEAGAPLALEMNPTPKTTPPPTPSPKPSYNPNPTLKPIPHPGAKMPPGTPPAPGSPQRIPSTEPPPAAVPAPAPSQPTEPKLDNSGAPLF